MPERRISHADISLRHFPDISDASFQIPFHQDDGLLNENGLRDLELDFDAFDNSNLDDDPFTTPLPKSKKHAPLTLSELTPRAEREYAETVRHREAATREDDIPRKQGEKPIFVRSTLPKKESVDDMFERRKRDNYQQMGIDLSSKSTARLRRDHKQTVRPDQVGGTARDRVNPSATSIMGARQLSYATGDQTGGLRNLKTKTKRSVVNGGAGVSRRKPHIAPSTRQPKSILKPPKPTPALPPSTFTRTLTAASHTPKAERPRWGDVVTEVQQTQRRRESSGSGIVAMGGGLIDVLVMYGEKLKGSLGFSSSTTRSSTPQAPSNNTHPRPQNGFPNSDSLTGDAIQHMQNVASPSAGPLTLSDISPSRRRQRDVLTLSDLSPSKQNRPVHEEYEADEAPLQEISPMRPSRKRLSPGTPSQGSKKDRLADAQDPVPSSSSQTLSRPGTANKAISRPKPLGPSNAANKVSTNPRPRNQTHCATEGVAPKTRHVEAAASARDPKARSTGKRTVTTRNRHVDKEQHPPVKSMPPGPVFASDIYRQRALEKTQNEREKRDERDRDKRSFKAGVMPCFSKPAPPARPAVRPTVPAAFTFHSDVRVAQRNAEFEEKRKTWESRAAHHALPMPDFAAMHAAQAGAIRNRRVVPVLPTDAPTLTTTLRAMERGKFEAERREREKAIEQQRETREKERAEQEERDYREARKRTVPKAHEVPGWYKDLPKRREAD